MFKKGLAVWELGCLCFALYIFVGLFIGGNLMNYDLVTIFNVHAPFWICTIAGCLFWSITFPVAVFTFLLQCGGVHTPFFHLAMMLFN